MGNRYKQAWALVKNDLVRFKWGFVMTLLFSMYMSVTSLFMLNGVLGEGGEMYRFLSGTLDFVYLITLPNMGFFFSRRSMRYLQEDSYTKWMIKLRTLPIDIHTIALSRIMMMVVAFTLNMTLFISIQVIFSPGLRAELGPVSIMAYAFMLIAFSMIINMTFIIMELSYSGSKYFKGSLIILGFTTFLAIAIALSGGSFVLTIVYVAKYYPWFSGILALGVITQVLTLGIVRAKNAIRKRDLV
ncbi:hypothetical protein [Paenibacillus apiarius]|uniref:hypothetical protein n=1 Tax=Paenibacillus apiarius TaxID=46240 RepID=UPI003B3AF940